MTETHKAAVEALEAAIGYVERYGDSRKDAHYVEQFKDALRTLKQPSSVEVTEELPLDLTLDEFAEIFTHWKNQQGMNGFLTRMNVNHLIWMFECLKQNNLRITRAAATDGVKS